jgi:hypothetical protein
LKSSTRREVMALVPLEERERPMLSHKPLHTMSLFRM